MINDQIKESDWKIFKDLKPLALQRYCDRVVKDVDKVIHDEKSNSHERYLAMYKIVRDGDKKLAQMFDGFSRSKALFQLIMYCRDNLLSEDEIAQLSEETRERIQAVLGIREEDDEEN